MSEFKKEKFEEFLGVVRKYMQLRGNLSQKQLAEMGRIGDSTLSRFMNQKTNDFNPTIIASIIVVLGIPKAEFIDFVEENYEKDFMALLNYQKTILTQAPPPGTTAAPVGGEGDSNKTTVAQVRTAAGHLRNIPFGGENDRDQSFREKTVEKGRPLTKDAQEIAEQFDGLSAKHKLYIKDFFSMDSDGKDLVADVGNNIIRYIRQKGLE